MFKTDIVDQEFKSGKTINRYENDTQIEQSKQGMESDHENPLNQDDEDSRTTINKKEVNAFESLEAKSTIKQELEDFNATFKSEQK